MQGSQIYQRISPFVGRFDLAWYIPSIQTSTLERGFGQYMKDSWVEFKTSEGVFEMIVFLMNSIR